MTPLTVSSVHYMKQISSLRCKSRVCGKNEAKSMYFMKTVCEMQMSAYPVIICCLVKFRVENVNKTQFGKPAITEAIFLALWTHRVNGHIAALHVVFALALLALLEATFGALLLSWYFMFGRHYIFIAFQSVSQGAII